MPIQYAENLEKADINFASSGDQTIIAAPSQGYYAIDHINFVPTSATVIQFKDGSTAYGGAYNLDSKQPVTLENAMGNEKGVITISPKTAFVINSTNAVQVSGFVRYRHIGG